ncbi:MAG: phosphate ABC transporter permease PstA [Phenylobacterium sp.]
MSATRQAGRRVADIGFKVFCYAVTALALVALAAILWSLLSQGVGGLDLRIFTTRTMSTGSNGGLANAIVGSIEMCLLAMVIALTVGVLAGTWLAEYGGASPYGAVVRFLNDVLLSAPSILVGLFVYELLVAPFHGFSGFAGSVALALLAVPVITRTTEDVLLLQSSTLREAGVALGAPLSFVIREVLWRSARGGLLTGGLLAFARISGETAPLLFTALNNQYFNNFDLRQQTANLPTVIFNYALAPYDDLRKLAWVGALLIAGTVLAVTIVARIVAQEQKRS